MDALPVVSLLATVAAAPFTLPAQTVTGTVPVPAHRYEREVGDE